jgi:hypothetical protein
MHLARFANRDSKVWTYDRLGQFSPRQQSVRKVASENDLYAPGEAHPDPTSDELERWLGREIDGPAAPAIELIVRTKSPQLETAMRSRMAAYIGAQDLRTPKVRDMLLEEGDLALQRGKPDVVRNALAAIGEDTSPENVEAVGAGYELNLDKTFWLDFLTDNFGRAAGRALVMAWTTVAAPPNHFFVLNDVGIAKASGDLGHLVPYAPGWAGGITHWVVPLSSTLALCLSPDADWTTGTATPAWIKLVNERLVLDAERFVFAEEHSVEIEEWWKRSSEE